jgi:hypothetical protein
MLAFLAGIRIFFQTRVDISLEVLALRQQVAVLKRKRPRPLLNNLDRFFWTTLRNLWPRWSDVLVIVKPETVIGPSGGLPPVLALAIAAWRSIEGKRGASDSYPPHGA